MATHYGAKANFNGVEPSRSAQFDHIEQEVRRLVDMLDAMRPSPPQPASTRPPHPLVPVSFERGRAQMATQLLRERRLREQFLPANLFHDPAWDMLLDLYVAHYRRLDVGVSSLCIAACVPATTALRWIGSMEAAGLFKRSCDPNDRRRIFIALSEGGRLGMDAYFDKLANLRGHPDLV